MLIVKQNIFQGCRWTRSQRQRQRQILRRVQKKIKTEANEVKRGEDKIYRILTFFCKIIANSRGYDDCDRCQEAPSTNDRTNWHHTLICKSVCMRSKQAHNWRSTIATEPD
uniref:Uncharacterized protein n=1 Tax=Bactrocera latifrons TaxID=174628 RepID=A0A0K8U7G0_BACLA